jgi:carbon-monoxide dehydrogenase small subunit
MLMSAKALLNYSPAPSRDEARHALSGNLCRCTGYTKILDAVESAAKALASSGAAVDSHSQGEKA